MNGGSQDGMYASPPGGGYGVAQAKVAAPAIALMITAGLGIFLQLVGLLVKLLGIGIGAALAETQEQRLLQLISGPISIFFGVVGVIIGVVVLLGAMKMKRLESYGFAMTAAILAMIPCVSPCCLLGIPIGIWAVVVLVNPEVKTAFR
jgi:uncharacterized membrane protein